MEPVLIKFEPQPNPRMLNLGCGRQFHPDWINVDLEAVSDEVLEHDLTRGLPFEEESIDVVYHSHVLEHLKPQEGVKLLEECFRVMKPGGVLRIVVPDLECIARLYLENHQLAWQGKPGANTNYQWMKLELLDQMVRSTSGGQMGQYMANSAIENSNFVRSRVGDELGYCQALSEMEHKKANWWNRCLEWTQQCRTSLARFGVGLLLGRRALASFDEGLFRNQGEIHRWMYDRFSLRELCHQCGFENFRVCQAQESQIKNFRRFELDTYQGGVRKPDSLFVECEKPRLAVSLSRAA